MKRTKIQLSFTGLTDSKFLTKAGFISSSMKNNADIFKTPDPTLDDVDAEILAYQEALKTAEGLGKANISNKNNTREALETTLFLLGLYVMFVTKCEETIELSGFTVVKTPQARKLDSLGNVTLKQGISSGQIDALVPKGNATSFNFDITDELPTANSVWKTFPVSTSSYTFSNLVPGRQYYIRVTAIANHKQSVVSNIGTETAKL